MAVAVVFGTVKVNSGGEGTVLIFLMFAAHFHISTPLAGPAYSNNSSY